MTLRDKQAELKSKGLPWEIAKSFDGACVLATFVSTSTFPDLTHIGIRLQALSERPMTVQLLRVNSRALSIGAWAGTGMISTLALLLVAPARNQTFESMSFLVIPALAAALLGGFSNIWVAAGGGLAIGAIEGAAARIDGLANYRGALPFLLIAIALIWMRRRKVWDDAR